MMSYTITRPAVWNIRIHDKDQLPSRHRWYCLEFCELYEIRWASLLLEIHLDACQSWRMMPVTELQSARCRKSRWIHLFCSSCNLHKYVASICPDFDFAGLQDFNADKIVPGELGHTTCKKIKIDASRLYSMSINEASLCQRWGDIRWLLINVRMWLSDWR